MNVMFVCCVLYAQNCNLVMLFSCCTPVYGILCLFCMLVCTCSCIQWYIMHRLYQGREYLISTCVSPAVVLFGADSSGMPGPGGCTSVCEWIELPCFLCIVHEIVPL